MSLSLAFVIGVAVIFALLYVAERGRRLEDEEAMRRLARQMRTHREEIQEEHRAQIAKARRVIRKHDELVARLRDGAA